MSELEKPCFVENGKGAAEIFTQLQTFAGACDGAGIQQLFHGVLVVKRNIFEFFVIRHIRFLLFGWVSVLLWAGEQIVAGCTVNRCLAALGQAGLHNALVYNVSVIAADGAGRVFAVVPIAVEYGDGTALGGGFTDKMPAG